MGIVHVTVVISMSVVIWGTIFPSIRGQQVYEFTEGEDASVDFYHETTSKEATYSYDLFAPDQGCVFCVDAIMDTSCLKPGQRDRFLVISTRNKTSLIVTLLLRRMERSDRGFHVLIMRENIDGRVANLIQVAYIDALFPPGEARCDLQSSTYTSTWKELHCTATVGNDGKGNLTCFQNSTECVFLSPVSYSPTHISATFWVDMDYPVNCCSFATDAPLSPQSCRHFTYPPANKDD